MMPITVVKVRFESNLYNYANISSALNTIVKKEGVRGLFSGFGATAMRDAPFAGIYIVFYERCKTYLNGSESITYTKDPSIPSPKQDYSLQIFTNMTAGLIGGFGATLCTQPFDLMKSRIQLDPSQYPNSFVALKKIIHDQGKNDIFTSLIN
jgi:solute carrier family 25 protein 38